MTLEKLKLGNAIRALTKALGIPHCPKCEKRRLILNKIRKLGVKETARMLRAADNEAWSVEDIVKKMEDCCDEK